VSRGIATGLVKNISFVKFHLSHKKMLKMEHWKEKARIDWGIIQRNSNQKIEAGSRKVLYKT
jgi:hypothetical protein